MFFASHDYLGFCCCWQSVSALSQVALPSWLLFRCCLWQGHMHILWWRKEDFDRNIIIWHGHNGSHANSYNYCRESIRKSSVRRMGRTTKHHLRFAHNLSACVDVPDTLQTLQILPNGEWSVGYYYISGWCILHVVHYSVFDDELGRHACASFIICSRFLWARPTDSHAQCSHLTHPIQSTSSERIEGCRWKPAGCPKDGLCSTDPNSILCGSFRTVG